MIDRPSVQYSEGPAVQPPLHRQPMKVLVACEESQAVTIELRRLGHEAYSCDIEPCSGGHPEWHIQGDALPLIDGNCSFIDSGGGITISEANGICSLHSRLAPTYQTPGPVGFTHERGKSTKSDMQKDWRQSASLCGSWRQTAPGLP